MWCMHSGAHACALHTRVEARGYYWMSSLIAFHLSFWDRIFYKTWSLLIKLDWLANELRQEDHLSLPCQHAPHSVVTDVYCHSWPYIIAEDPNVSPHACTKYFTDSHLSSSSRSWFCISCFPWLWYRFDLAVTIRIHTVTPGSMFSVLAFWLTALSILYYMEFSVLLFIVSWVFPWSRTKTT